MKLKILRATRYFMVTPLTDEALRICLHFQHRFKYQKFTQDKEQQAPTTLYSTALHDNSEFRFHRNALQNFLNFLSDRNYKEADYLVEDKPLPNCVKRKIPVQAKWKDHDYQVPIVAYLVAPTPLAKFIGIQTGKGKSLALSEHIKIPGGWKTMGEMQVGDEVIAKDGTTSIVTGVYPQEEKQLYKMVFADGREIECCGEHLWRVYYVNTTPHKRWRVVNTLEVLRLISMPNPRVYIDLCDAEDVEDAVLPIDPYLLGVLLGDGGISQFTPRITTPDEFIVEEVRKVLPEGYEITALKQKAEKCPSYKLSPKVKSHGVNAIRSDLEEMQLDGTVSYNKFIPTRYLHASKKQRLALLQGLMDTDGTANTLHTGGAISYNTVSQKLAKDVQYLVWSLGGIASISERHTSYTHQGEKKFGRTSYDINIRYKKPSELFRLPKKKERTNDNNQYAADLKLRVMSVTPTKVERSQCISISHPDRLYVTTNFVVTHNTYCSLRGVSEAGLRTAIVVEGGMVTKWGKDVLKVLDIKAKNTLCVRGGNQLRGLIGMAGSKELEKVDVILISGNTLQDWITTHETLADRTNKDVGYGIEPSEFYEKLEIGHRLIDEVHKRFHFNFKQDLYCNAQMVTSLSATLFSYDKTMENFYEIAYPKAERYDGGELDKYIKTYAVMWRPQKGRRIKATEYGRSTYSHIAVEKSIMRNKPLMDNYFEMIAETLEQGYVPNYKEGNKAAVFVASTDMATALVKFLRVRFPKYSCERYASSTGDPYDNLMDPDLRVTTLGSGGTGHDMPGLTDTILTVGIMSLQANIQVLGRLRFIPDQDTRFYYMTCLDLEAQMRYHGLKMKLMEERAKSFEIMDYGIAI